MTTVVCALGFPAKGWKSSASVIAGKQAEKGVGRICVTDWVCVGLWTQAENQKAFGLAIDWNLFDVEGENLSDIPLPILEDVAITLPEQDRKTPSSGTELIIRGLREQWTPGDIRALYEELTVLTPPFQKVQDFQIYLKTDIETDYKGLVTSSFQEVALIEMDAHFDGHTLRYRLLDRSDNPA